MSTIPDYNTNLGGFVDWLNSQSLDQLPGNKNPKLAELLALLEGKITLSADQPTPLSKIQLEKLLAQYLTDPAMINGPWLTNQFQQGQESAITAIKGLIEQGERREPKITSWTISEFMLFGRSALTMERIDDDLIDIFKGVMAFQDSRRNELRDELVGMTSELKIYGVIQSEINKVLSSGSQTFKTDFNLLNYKLYGYESQAKFMDGAEYKLLSKMLTNDDLVKKAQQDLSNAENELARLKVEANSGLITVESIKASARLPAAQADYDNKKVIWEQVVAGLRVTVKDFLESAQKKSGAMKDIEASYSYDKDNNKLGNFSTSVSDRSRPLNDQVSETTTRLNDVSSRYNSAIEALNRFIQKYESMMQQILQAI